MLETGIILLKIYNNIYIESKVIIYLKSGFETILAIWRLIEFSIFNFDSTWIQLNAHTFAWDEDVQEKTILVESWIWHIQW